MSGKNTGQTEKQVGKSFIIRGTEEDCFLIDQAAERMGLSRSDWVRQSLKDTAIREIYGENEASEEVKFSPGEQALMRIALIILQIVSINVPEDIQRAYAEKAKEKIEKLKNEPPRFYRRVELSKDEPYGTEEIPSEIHVRIPRTRCSALP